MHVSFQLEIILALRAAGAWSWNEPWRRFKGEKEESRKAVGDGMNIEDREETELIFRGWNNRRWRWLDKVGLGRRKGAEVDDNLEGEINRRRTWRVRMRRGEGYVTGKNWMIWYVAHRGEEVRWSSAVTERLNIRLLRQEGQPNIKDRRWFCGGCGTLFENYNEALSLSCLPFNFRVHMIDVVYVIKI